MTTSPTRTRTSGRVHPALLAPAVVAIVLGILSMHGPDAHRVNMPGVTMHRTMAHAEAATSSAVVMAGHDPVAVVGEDGRTTAGAGTHAGTHAGDHDSGDVGMMMLCVAMLAGAAAALLGLLVHRGRLAKVWAALQVAGRVGRPAPHVLRVGTGPPSVWRFSVIRC